MINGRGEIYISPNEMISSNGTVDVRYLAAKIAHEGQHIWDFRTLGVHNLGNPIFPSEGFANINQYRWSEQNDYQTRAIFNKAVASPQRLDTYQVNGVNMTLTTQNYRDVAEASVNRVINSAAARNQSIPTFGGSFGAPGR